MSDVSDRGHLSIGEVLTLLKVEFPDITISKIRFLESQGLLDPERTPSGYRKFYEDDIERLRWILQQQKDNFLPLKVIRDRLEGDGGAPEDSPSGPPSLFSVPTGAGAVHPLDEVQPVAPPAEIVADPGQGGVVTTAAGAASVVPVPSGTRSQVRPVIARRTAPELGEGRPGHPAAALPAPPPPLSGRVVPGADATSVRAARDAGPSAVSMNAEELQSATGLSSGDLADLERFGLLKAKMMGREAIYDEEALVVGRLAASFAQFGVEARHLRMYKVAAEREAAFFEQVVLPLLKQRNPDAKRKALTNLDELARLGESLHAACVRQALAGYTG